MSLRSNYKFFIWFILSLTCIRMTYSSDTRVQLLFSVTLFSLKQERFTVTDNSTKKKLEGLKTAKDNSRRDLFQCIYVEMVTKTFCWNSLLSPDAWISNSYIQKNIHQGENFIPSKVCKFYTSCAVKRFTYH